MSVFRQSILPFTSLVLAMLIILLGIKAAQQDAPELSGTRHSVTTAASGQHTAFHRIIASRKDTQHPGMPARHKHHRSRGHRVPVANASAAPVEDIPAKPLTYRRAVVARLASVYPYEFFREITPPPPKEC